MFGKKDKTEMKILFNFSYTELTAIEEYFEQFEKDGWRLEEFDGWQAVFKKAEPRVNIRYSAEIYKGTFGEDFISSCEAEGWEHCGIYKNTLYIFRTDKENITEIMTDKEEKMKTIRKRALLRPGNLSVFIVFLCYLIDLLIDVDIADLDISSGLYWFGLLFVIWLAFNPVSIVLNYLIWFIRAKRSLKKGEDIKYDNYKQTRIRAFAETVFSFLWIVGSLIFIYIIDSGYFAGEKTIYWFILSMMLLALSDFIGFIKNSKKSSKAIKILFFGIAVILLVSGIYFTTVKSEKKYEELKESIYSTVNIPFSLSNMGYEEKYCIDEGEMAGTIFAQKYRFKSEYYNEEYEPIIPTDEVYMSYEIFVSDYESIKDRYIDKVLKKYEKYDYEIKVYEGEDTRDIVYREIFPYDENWYSGLAIKDNTVFYLDVPLETESEDFFEQVYAELFS